MACSSKTPFEKGYIIAKAHYEECGTLDVPTNFQHKSGFWIGSWIDKIRKKKDELTDEQIERLDQIGFVWEQTDNFEERFATAKAYYEIHGCLPLEPKHCKTKAELHICQWLGSIEKTKQINLATLSGAVAQILGLVMLYVIGCFSIVNVAIMRNLSEFIMFAVLLFFVIKYRKQFALEQKNNQSLSGDDNTNN